MKPLVILGLDGIDPYLIENNIDELENLRQLDESGNSGLLESTLPPITVPAWISSFTGKKPEKLERFDFQVIDFENYGFAPAGQERYWFQEFWNYMDGKSAIADVPGATVHEIDGWMVGGIFDVSTQSTYPEELYTEMEEDLGEFRLEGIDYFGSEKERRESFYDSFEKRRDTLEWLMDRKDAEVYFMVFRLPDNMMHHCSDEEIMLDAYRECDELLGELMERDVNIIALSDHGAVKADRRFSINTWLRENGFLEMKEEESSRVKEKLKSLVLGTAEVFESAGLRDYLVRINDLYGNIAGEKFVSTDLDFDSIDWEGTEAFSYMTGVCGYAGIWINDDRFPQGTVEDRQAKKKEIKGKLERHELVENVLLKEEAFDVDVETFPDLVVVFEEKVKNDSDIKPNVTGKLSSYMHRKQGYIGLYGNVFDFDEEDAELVDLAPTVLHYFGEDIPEEMDGKVMDIFSASSEPGKRQRETTSEDVHDLDF